MKLRNKKTSRIFAVGDDIFICNDNLGKIKLYWKTNGEDVVAFYNDLLHFNEDWEDYTPKEPLIKDPKILKAVRLWAEVNDFEPEFEMRYSSNCFGLISWQANIEFNIPIEGLEDGGKYTITELCGEEEDE